MPLPNGESYADRIQLPDWQDLNSGLTSASSRHLADVLGNPRTDYGFDCQQPNEPTFNLQLWNGDIGPFVVEGHHLFLRALRNGFNDLRLSDPSLLPLIGNAGCLCCRWVRGFPGVISNHSFGCAIDLKVGGIMPPLGAGWWTRGHEAIYQVMHKQKIYSGAGYHNRKDPMHFEASNELLNDWVVQGMK